MVDELSQARVTDVTSPPKIGLVSPLPPQVGGMPSVAEWLLAHEDEIGCVYETFDLWRPPEEEKGGRVRLSTLPRQARLLARFVRWLPSAPGVVHYSLACSLLGLTRDLTYVAILRLSRRTVIAHIHGSDLVGLRRASARALGLRILSRLSTERVAVAPRAASALESVGVPARCIYNPVRFEPNGHESAPSRAPLRLLFVGTYGERKGCPELLEALAAVRASGVEATLRLVGKEEQRGEEGALRRSVRAFELDGVVEFAGVMSAQGLASCYENADVICLPSRREQLPMALLEGMAFGLPALATPVGAIPDLVEDGETGLLVEPGNVDELTAAIRSLAGDPARLRAMGEAARARVESVASAGAVAAQWRRLYRECGSAQAR